MKREKEKGKGRRRRNEDNEVFMVNPFKSFRSIHFMEPFKIIILMKFVTMKLNLIVLTRFLNYQNC